MLPIRILLCDVSHVKNEVAAANTVPIGIGMIGSYIKSLFNDHIEIKLCKFPEKVVQYLNENKFEIVCFSNYVWNFDLSCKLAELAKQINSKTVVIFGGPNYPEEPQKQAEFFLKNTFINFYIYKEAELPLGNLIKILIANNFDIQKAQKEMIEGCHFYNDREFIAGKVAPRIANLDDIPSPYTLGMLDEFLDGKLIPLIQTNRGCPFSCTYCSEGNMYHNKIVHHGVERVYEDLSYIAQKYKGPSSLFIADSNFGMYERDINICYKIAEIQKIYGWPKYINVATGKNQKQRVIKCAEIIGGALRLGASVQSTDPAVLKNIKRENLSIKEIISVGKAAGLTGANTYSEAILCLPGETKESHLNTIKEIIRAELNFIRCYSLMLLPGAELASIESIEKFKMVKKYRILPRCFGEYKINDTKIIKSAEIEEVCVGTDTMTFDEYLECRQFHLTIDLFYNDGIFRELILLSKIKKLDVADLMVDINKSISYENNLRNLYSMFLSETKAELYGSREKLLKVFNKNIDKYFRGEIGANLIFKYKTIGLFSHIDAIHTIAYASFKKLIGNNMLTEIERQYLEDLELHSLFKKSNFFSTDKVIRQRLRFDMIEAEKQQLCFNPSLFYNKEGVEIEYFHTTEQKNMINKHLDILGNDLIGIARFLGSIRVNDLYRQCRLAI